jgi:hypothetical protein
MVEKHSYILGSCRCGAVEFEVSGPPIIGAVCCCASCQEAGRRFELEPDAPRVLNAHGGTDFLLYRKDRVRFLKGGDRLEAHKLKPDSPTRRVVAACCQSPVFLEFSKGHWLSVYRDRLPADAPPLEMRVMAADRRAGIELPGDMPNYGTHSVRFMWKLLAAWIAMGLRTKRVEGMSL